MYGFVGTLVATIVLTLGIITPAKAQEDICYDLTRKNIRSLSEIEPCTRDINSGRLKGQELARAYLNRGIVHEDIQDFDRAFADYDTAIRINPKYAYAYVNRGDIHERRGNRPLAFDDFATALRLEPNDANNWNVRCWALVRANIELNQALSDCNRAIEINSKSAVFFKNRGMVHFRLGNYQQAIADLDVALGISPRMSNSLYLRGLSKLKIGNASGGDADIAAAKSIRPGIVAEYAGYGIRP